MKSGIREGTIFKLCKLTIMEIVRIVFHYFPRFYNATMCLNEMKEIINARVNPWLDQIGDAKKIRREEVYKLHLKSVSKLYKLTRYNIHLWL